MSTTFSENNQERPEFAHWLRTGRRLRTSDTEIEFKFNPWHDPDDGRFTHAGTGNHFGPGSVQSADRRADRGGKVAENRRREVASRSPVTKAGEFVGGFRRGLYDTGKETVADLYEIATTNPVTTGRNFVEGFARSIDAAIAADDTPARVQIRRAQDAVANASARDLGYATGKVAGNVGLAAVPGASAIKISGVRKLRAIRPRETFDPPKIIWRKETLKDGPAKDYNDTAKGARPNQAPALVRTMPDGAQRLVKFDGIDADYPIDRKLKVVDSPRARAQMIRQSDALSQNRSIGIWEVPDEKQKKAFIRMRNKTNVKNINVRIVKP